MKVKRVSIYLQSMAILVLATSADSIAYKANPTYGKSFYLGQSAVVVGNGVLEKFNYFDDYKSNNKVLTRSSLQVNGGTNFRAGQMTQFLFFNGTQTMTFGQVASTSAATDIYSSYFLLPESASTLADTWTSVLTANPLIINFTADIRFAFDLNAFVGGMYVEANFPIVWTQWNMRLSEVTSGTATTYGSNQYFSHNTAGSQAAYTKVKDAFVGRAGSYDVAARQYGNIDGSQSKIALGDAKLAIGYNVFHNRTTHNYLGIALLGVFNSDSNSAKDAQYLGNPVIGTAGRQGIGGRFEGGSSIYESGQNSITFYGRADIFHAFSSVIMRSYDATLKYGIGSRYIPMKQFTTALGYADIMMPLINLSTLRANISIPALYDVTLALRYTCKNVFVDLGYELEGHTSESHNGWVDTFTPNLYGAMCPAVAQANGATSIDFAQGVTISGATLQDSIPTQTAIAINNALTLADLDVNTSLAPSATTNRIFVDIGYAFENAWKPFVLVGGGAAIGNTNTAPCQWEIHASGGITF